MNKSRLSKPSALLFLWLVLLTGGLNGTSSAETAADPSACYPNYILDNGAPLLGNKAYPAISYSGYRTTTRTEENCPSTEQLSEDMKILAALGIKILRTYNTHQYPQTRRMLQAIRRLKQADPDFEMYVMIGAWIRCAGAGGPAPDHSRGDTPWNRAEIDTAIEMAAEYPDIVKIIAVGNEATVTWQTHFVPHSVILRWVRYLKEARADGRMPPRTLVTTSDNWAALGGAENYHSEELLALLREIDFVSLHTYAFHDTYYDPSLQWAPPPDSQEENLPTPEQTQRAIDRALQHQIRQYQAVRDYLSRNGIQKSIHIGETGWAGRDNSHYGSRGTCAADEYKATLFYAAVRDWTTRENLTCFYFQAFDEPWKSGGTDGSEGHFGLFTVEGKAKYMLWEQVDAGRFEGLTRGGNPILKTRDGKVSALLKDLKPPAHKKFQ